MNASQSARLTALALALATARVAPLAAQEHAHDHTSPYAAYLTRDIKALAPEEVQALLGGEGAGFALAAELNGYPGPRHVLDMAPALGLSAEQVARVRAVFDEMQARARALGWEVVDRERELDRAFASGTLGETRLAELVDAAGAARSRLRTEHLRAHLRVLPILTPAQRAQYQRARGYAG